MRSHPIARLAGLCLAALLSFGAALPTTAAARCAGKQVRSACCCHDAVPTGDRVERRCCCEVDAGDGAATPHAQRAATSPRGPEIVSLALLSAPSAPSVVHAPAPARVPTAPPSTGPPLLLRKQSFLI